MVWQRLAKSPGEIAVQRSILPSPPMSRVVNRVTCTGGCQRSSLTRRKNTIRTCSSAESERDSAKVEVARSNRARSTNSKFLRSGRVGKARVSETRLRHADGRRVP